MTMGCSDTTFIIIWSLVSAACLSMVTSLGMLAYSIILNIHK